MPKKVGEVKVMVKTLSDLFTINRRFARSVNLDRDFDSINALQGYILTDRSTAVLEHILIDFISSDTTSATTITSVYGTGKSAFANFLMSLCAEATNPVRQVALDIAKRSLTQEKFEKLVINLPQRGFFRAIAIAQREPLSHAIIRALTSAMTRYGKVSKKLKNSSSDALSLLKEVLASVDQPVILIIDELGKSLEYAALHQRSDDLYLLQQIAELSLAQDQSLYLIGLLHQSFADYGYSLALAQRNEWAKIQGRFQDFAFSSQPRQMTNLIGQAITNSLPSTESKKIRDWAKKWYESLTQYGIADISIDLLASIYPIQPIAALVLPVLCSNYAQNDRSLFTFLSSHEAFSFQNYLQGTNFTGNIATLKLDCVYDYFVEAIGSGFTSRPELHKWVEIHNLIRSVGERISKAELVLLKTIGVLNLVDSIGEFKAKPALVRLALVDQPDQISEINTLVTKFKDRGIINIRRDELRLWEGTDFDIASELNVLIETEQNSLAEILTNSYQLKPTIAQRHSYSTGTVRYFEARFVDSSANIEKLKCSHSAYDGAIVYWLDASRLLDNYPSATVEGKPLIVIVTDDLNALKSIAKEFHALKKLQLRPELLNDKVARNEVNYRLQQAEQRMNIVFKDIFNFAHSSCWILGKLTKVLSNKEFNFHLSCACDEVYHKSSILRNELINRRELTGQAVKALRVLIEALLDRPDQKRLGLEGFGPETSIYESILRSTDIHRQEDGIWGIYPPLNHVCSIWEVIASFCRSAVDKSISLDILYQQLESPPYGVKRGVIPLFLASVMLYYSDEVSVYKDGVFIPVLGSHHFELLVKNPQHFAVRYFEIIGVRSQVFRQLQEILKSPHQKPNSPKVRNSTILSVVRPLIHFSKSLPAYTKRTSSISASSQKVIQVLDTAQEPDELIFKSLPVACGLEAISSIEDDTVNVADEYKKRLVKALQEIQSAYDNLLSKCYDLLHDAFSVSSGKDNLREDLRVRASYLKDSCLEKVLKRFILAAIDSSFDDKSWVESLLMVVTDKPPKVWTDQDFTVFEIKLSDLARRFANLEALQKEMVTRKHQGFEAVRMTVTRASGEEIHRLLWIEPENDESLEELAKEILDNPLLQGKRGNRLQQAIIAKLADKVFAEENNPARLIETANQRAGDQLNTSPIAHS